VRRTLHPGHRWHPAISLSHKAVLAAPRPPVNLCRRVVLPRRPGGRGVPPLIAKASQARRASRHGPCPPLSRSRGVGRAWRPREPPRLGWPTPGWGAGGGACGEPWGCVAPAPPSETLMSTPSSEGACPCRRDTPHGSRRWIQGIGKDGEVPEKTLRIGAVRVFERVRKGGTGRFGHPCVRAGRGIERECTRKRQTDG
jgi:hypothetical protein